MRTASTRRGRAKRTTRSGRAEKSSPTALQSLGRAVEARTERPSALSTLRRRKLPDLMSVLGLILVALLFVWLIKNAIDTPRDFFNVMLIGLTLGAVYALVALGYTLVYGILQLINFAHGDVFALSGLFASTLVGSAVFGLTGVSSTFSTVGGLAATFVIAAAFGATINSSIEFLAYRRLRNAPRLSVLITAVGMSFIVQNISLAIYDVNAHSIPPLVSSSYVFNIHGVHYSWDQFFVVLVTAPVLVLLSWLVKTTKQGKAMHATSQDPEAAAIMGIDVNRTISFTFALAGGLAGVGAVLFLTEFNMRYDTGFTLAVTYPFYVDSLPTNIPIILSFPTLHDSVTILVFVMMAVGLNVVVGYAGLLDLGYVAFYAIGAYTAGWLASGQFQQVNIHVGSVGVGSAERGIHVSVWMVLLIAGVVTAIGGILIGLPTLRLRGDYLAIVTLGFGEIIPQFVRNADNLHGFDLTHGTFGISPIDAPGFGQSLHNAVGLPVRYDDSFPPTPDRLFFRTILGLLLLTVFF